MCWLAAALGNRGTGSRKVTQFSARSAAPQADSRDTAHGERVQARTTACCYSGASSQKSRAQQPGRSSGILSPAPERVGARTRYAHGATRARSRACARSPWAFVARRVRIAPHKRAVFQVPMDGLEAMHDDGAAGRGWSPRQLHRLNSYLLGGSTVDGGYANALGDESGARAASGSNRAAAFTADAACRSGKARLGCVGFASRRSVVSSGRRARGGKGPWRRQGAILRGRRSQTLVSVRCRLASEGKLLLRTCACLLSVALPVQFSRRDEGASSATSTVMGRSSIVSCLMRANRSHQHRRSGRYGTAACGSGPRSMQCMR